jgi:IS4 transposase
MVGLMTANRWEQEALSAGESKKMLTVLTDAASKRNGMISVPFRGSRSMKRFVVKADEKSKGRAKEKAK